MSKSDFGYGKAKPCRTLLVRAEGIEPSTFPLSEECSTTELSAREWKCSKNGAYMLGSRIGRNLVFLPPPLKRGRCPWNNRPGQWAMLTHRRKGPAKGLIRASTRSKHRSCGFGTTGPERTSGDESRLLSIGLTTGDSVL